MCGRFNLTAPGEEIAAAFGLDEVPSLSARYNIAPSQAIAAVGFQPLTGRRGLAELTWGLALRNAKPGEKRLINARAETAADRPALPRVVPEAPLPRSRDGLLRVGEAAGREAAAVALPAAGRGRLRVRRPVGAGAREGRPGDVPHPHDGAERSHGEDPRSHAGHPPARGLRAVARSRGRRRARAQSTPRAVPRRGDDRVSRQHLGQPPRERRPVLRGARPPLP